MEVCSICKREYRAVWTAPDDLWKKLNGGNEGGLICMGCFDKIARKNGLVLYWECAAGGYPVYSSRISQKSND
jgi:hypothetical protein